MSVSRTCFARLIAAVLLSAFAFSSFVVAETTEGLTPSPASMDRQTAAERQPSSITGVLMQARGGRATTGGFLDTVNGIDKGPPSNCCSSGAKGTPGCDDATCESDVCDSDPYCCDTDWDSECEDQAELICEVCGGTPPAADILVNTNADGIPTDDGFCTLREAVMTANGIHFNFKTEGECESFEVKGFGPPPGPTTIDFDPLLAGATISLTMTDIGNPLNKGIDLNGFFGPTALVVISNIVILGDPDDGIIIERDSNAPDMRLFLILSEDVLDCLDDKGGGPCAPCPKGGCAKGLGPDDAAVAFENVTLRGGIARGGDGGDGGFDEVMQAAKGDFVAEATLEGGGGGGAGGFGGAVLNLFGFVSFENSTLTNNQAIGGNGGIAGAAGPAPKPKGGLANATGGGGGGIGGDGFDGGSFGSESGEGGGLDGGTSPGSSGFFGGGGAGASDSFSGGDGGGFGGGGGGASVTLSYADKGEYNANSQSAGGNFFIGGGGGGGARADITTDKGGTEGFPDFGGYGAGDGSFESGGGGAGMGGAVFNLGGEAISINSTFSGNAAIGGTGEPPPPPKGGELGSTQGQGLGGGIINVSGFVFMNNTTLSGNRADEGGGAVFHLEAGDLDPECLFKGECECGATTVFFDSILANSPNSASDFDSDDISGGCFKGLEPGFVFAENSLIEAVDKSAPQKGGSNVIGGDPQLGALADNGGPNNTHLPQPGSPVIDAVISPTPKTEGAVFDPLSAKGGEFGPVFCEETDQRGVERIQLEECDMGSVEVVPGTIQICKQEDPAPQVKTLGWNFGGDLGDFGLNHDQCTKPFEEAPGTYTVVEASNEPFFYLGAINCESDGTLDVSVDVPSRDVDITVVEDENVTCTFVNEQAGNITITKSTNVATAELFGFNDDIPVPPPPKEGEKGPGPDFTLASGASQVFTFIQPGTYAVSEIDPFPENFALNSIVCPDGNSSGSGLTATINLEPGENVECTFNNVELEAQLSLNKNADGVPTDAFVGDQYVYHLILTNNGPGFGTNVVVNDPLSPLLAFVSSACATEDPPGTVRWEVGTILAGQTLFCDFTVEILDIGFIENVAFADGDQGDTGGGNEGRVIVKGATPTIPTLGPWALGLLALVLGFAGVARIRRR